MDRGLRADDRGPDDVTKGFRSTFENVHNDDGVVVRRAMRELTIWFRARHGEAATQS